MYYPVEVDGGLFSIGDPHVSQGDGELSGTAIEASLDVFQIVVRKDFSFPAPLLETPEYWIVHGFNEDLNVAMRNASLDMLGLLTEQHRLSRDDAYSLMSVAADFAVTQVVDGKQGIHVRIPRGIFPTKKFLSISPPTILRPPGGFMRRCLGGVMIRGPTGYFIEWCPGGIFAERTASRARLGICISGSSPRRMRGRIRIRRGFGHGRWLARVVGREFGSW
jgi:hypothetical protein